MTSEVLCNNPNMGDPFIAAAAHMRSQTTEFPSFSLYTCRVCSRAFPTTQALGGHQTAHRKEKSERLDRLIRQAEIDMLKYAADNDVVLSPEPISWAPPAFDDQPFKMYNFMPGSYSENKAEDVDKKKKKQKKRKFMDLSGSSEVNNEASDQDQKRQKKRKCSTKSSECSENKAADEDKTEKKNRKKRKSTKQSECSEHKASNTEKKNKKSKYMKLFSECSEINSGSDTDKNRSGCSDNKASAEADQNKSQFITKLMPSPDLTLGTGAAPDVLVQVYFTDSNDESGHTEYIY